MQSEELFPLVGKRIWVAGHRGMVGAAVIRRLAGEGCELLTVDRSDVDLRCQSETESWISRERPDAIVLAAAKVGGILANNTYPADFLYDNIMIQSNVIHSSYRHNVKKLVFLGSSCIYPKYAEQPIEESSLLTGPLEPTNEWYAIAKIAGIKLAEAYKRQHGCDFISLMPTNLYGPEDNFDLSSSHVVPALIRKAHEAKLNGSKELKIWGTGSPKRELMHVDDCADAIVFLLQNYSGVTHINVGQGSDLSIYELAETVARIVGFEGGIATDLSKPDGTPRKLMSADLLRSMGWKPRIELEAGLRSTYEWFLRNRPT